MNYKKALVLYAFLYTDASLLCYGLPAGNLGFTNILDGGPVRPNPGFYIQNYSVYYHTKTFLDTKGKQLPGLDGTPFNSWTYLLQFIYQFNEVLNLNAMPGFSAVIPFTFYSHIKANAPHIKSAGGGPGRVSFGPYLQWKAVFFKERPIFIHRLSLDFTMPSLRNKSPEKQINPGDAFFSISPSWSATLYAAERLAFSWRLTYSWNQKSRKVDFKAGDAIYFNYSTEHEVIPNLWLACVGYYVQQISDNKVNGLKVLHSRERVVGLGPGAAYFYRKKDMVFFGYFYKEFAAINRTQGMSFILRFIQHF